MQQGRSTTLNSFNLRPTPWTNKIVSSTASPPSYADNGRWEKRSTKSSGNRQNCSANSIVKWRQHKPSSAKRIKRWIISMEARQDARWGLGESSNKQQQCTQARGSGRGRRLVSGAEVFVHLGHGAPLNALVGVDPVDEAFVHGKHLGPTRDVRVDRDLQRQPIAQDHQTERSARSQDTSFIISIAQHLGIWHDLQGTQSPPHSRKAIRTCPSTSAQCLSVDPPVTIRCLLDEQDTEVEATQANLSKADAKMDRFDGGKAKNKVGWGRKF